MAALFTVALGVGLLSVSAEGQRGGITHRGTVVMTGPSAHSSKSKGVGHVLLHGAYYVAPTVSCSLTVSNMDLLGISDGTRVYVTIEYFDPTIPPQLVGAIDVVNHGGSFSNTTAVTVNTTTTISTMSVRNSAGEVLMFGQVKGLP